MSFEKLTKKELLRTADEDFAVETDQSWNKSKIIEALNESGVDFAQYLEQNPDKAEEFAEVPKNVQVIAQPTASVPAEKEDDSPKILIKMVRDNPLYEIGRYRWTTRHPYVAVDLKDADRILIKEDGFRQATPGELAEYYSKS